MATVKVEEQGIVPIVQQELDNFANEAKSYQQGQKDETEFQIFRLREGTYGQRQADVHMIRIKVPGGHLSARQLEVLGDAAKNHTPLDKGHITTRECIQMHHIPLPDAVALKHLIASVGLTSREACGNTVRNVITCPLAGICRDEEFDINPYLAAYVRYFIRKPFTQAMPRKFKSSFSPCASDCANAPYHDIGFVAQVQEIDGVKRKGFRIHVGGGSSIMPRMAPVLYDFVPVEEYLRVAEAVLRVFNQSDELRKNRMMARIKVLVDRIGMDAFRERVETELKEPWAEQPIDPTPYLVEDYEPVPGPYQATNGHSAQGEDSPEFLHWKSTNLVEQRQPGYIGVWAKVASGDLSSEQFYAIADLTRRFGNGTIRLDFDQNFLFRWVPQDKVYELYQEMQKLDLAEAGVHEITDVTSCPGTDSCKMGITSSMGAGRAAQDTIMDLNIVDPLTRKMNVKVSGCPNGCGRHHLASIGFQGAAIKGADGDQVPAYEVYIGGRYKDGEFRYAKRITQKIPAKRLPEAITRVIGFYEGKREQDETFDDFVDRIGHSAFEPLLSDLRGVGPVAENMALYEDWERMGLYKLERGEGECAV